MQDDIAGTLRAEGEDRHSRPSHVVGVPMAPVAFAETAPTLSVGAHGAAGHPHRQHGNETGSGRGCATAAVALPMDPFLGGEVTIAIDASYAKGCGGTSVAERPVVAQAMQVRRLTPVECERLQGFPDGYTAIPWRGKPASECPDGPRYKALGNSWAVPVVRWIGRRIDAAVRQA